jgi:hypothetical protein
MVTLVHLKFYSASELITELITERMKYELFLMQSCPEGLPTHASEASDFGSHSCSALATLIHCFSCSDPIQSRE